MPERCQVAAPNPYPIPGPLNGLKVITFEHAWAAPYGTMMLADMGADVVKVEPPGLGDHVRAWTRNDLAGISPHFLSANRNKRSIVLDLKNQHGVELARRLVSEADALVENFSPGVMKRLGLGYSRLSKDHESLVFCSVSGFGQQGPFSHRRAYDLLIQAEGGLLSVTGTDETSLAKVGVSVVDILSAMVAAFATLAALREAEQTGKGRYIDIAMLDVATSVMSFNLLSYAISGVLPKPIGTAHPLLAPYEVYETRTHPVAVAVLTEAHWQTFCSVIDRPDLQDRVEFTGAPARLANRDLLNGYLRPLFATWDGDALVEALVGAGLACANVNNAGALLEHPQLRDRGFYGTWDIGDEQIVAPGAPWRMVGNDSEAHDDLSPAAKPGQHAEVVLSDWIGAGDDELDQLRSRGALG